MATRKDTNGWSAPAQDRIIQAIVCEAQRAREDKHFGGEELADWIEYFGTRLAKQYGLQDVPGLPKTFGHRRHETTVVEPRTAAGSLD